MDAEDYREARELARIGDRPTPNEKFAELHKIVRDAPENKGKRAEKKPKCYLCDCTDPVLLNWSDRPPGFWICDKHRVEPPIDIEVKINDGAECPF